MHIWSFQELICKVLREITLHWGKNIDFMDFIYFMVEWRAKQALTFHWCIPQATVNNHAINSHAYDRNTAGARMVSSYLQFKNFIVYHTLWHSYYWKYFGIGQRLEEMYSQTLNDSFGCMVCLVSLWLMWERLKTKALFLALSLI